MFLLFVLFVMMGVLVGVGGVVVDVVLGRLNCIPRPNQFCCDKFFDN